MQNLGVSFKKLLSRGSVALVTLSLMTGCACRTTKTNLPMDKGSNIPTTEGDGPLKDINFAFDSYALTPTAKGIISSNAAWLNQHPMDKVEVQGHCDERGTNEYNMVLGANRARSGADYLKSQNVDASRMSTVSFGEELPLDPRHNEAAWAKNRRDHFSVVGGK